MTVSAQITQFIYDGDGNMVKKIKPDGSKTLYVGGIYEVDKTGGTVTGTKTYYPAAGAMRIGSALYYTLKDHLGSTSVVTNSTGVVVGEDRFYPFGETRFTTGTIYTDKLFTGQRDTGLGIYDYKARFYSPKLGRFLSPDNIIPDEGNPQAYNRYSYVLNNPIRYNDPTGHMVAEGDGGGGGCGQHEVYSPKCPGWHSYQTTNVVCLAKWHCTKEQMKDFLSRFAFPGQDPSQPVTELRYDAVTDPWLGLLPRAIGLITTSISDDGLTATNQTRPGHILHDGKIDRTISQMPDGSWIVTTHGYGNNKSAVFDAQRPDLPPIPILNFALVNIWGGKAIFNEVDEQMLNYIAANH